MLRPKQRFSEVTRPKYNCTSVPHSRKLKYPLALEIATKTKSVRPGDFQHVHHTYVFQNESTLYSCLNVKEILAGSRREIWSLSDCNWTRNPEPLLVCKRTLNNLAKLASLAKWLSVRLRTKWFWVRVQLQSLKLLLLILNM